MRRLALIAFFVFAFAPFARAEEELVGDPAALLREAKSAETVDRDPAKALELYRRVFEVGGTSDAAREAGLKAAEILENADGRAEEARQALALFTDRFPGRLDDATKNRVRRLTLRLLAPPSVGQQPSTAPASPLDAKIANLLERYTTTEQTDAARYAVRSEIIQMLRPVGAGALPGLERAIVSNENPAAANFAAELYGIFAGSKGVAVLERLSKTGDGFTQGAAILGLGAVSVGPESSPKVVETIDRLLQVESLADRHRALLDVQSKHLPAGGAMERHRQGGPYAMYWLRVALGRMETGALERALDIARQGGPEGKDAASALMNAIAFKPRQDRTGYSTDSLDIASVDGIVQTLMASSSLDDRQDRQTLVQLMRLRVAKAPEDKKEEAMIGVWDQILGVPDERVRSLVVRELLENPQGMVPRTLFDEPNRARSALRQFASPDVMYYGGNARNAFAAFVQSDGSFWDALAAALPTLSPDGAALLLTEASNNRAEPFPARVNARWIDALASFNSDNPPPNSQRLIKGAAQSGDPRFLDLVRRNVEAGVTRLGKWLLNEVQEYRGPGRLEFAMEGLRNPNLRSIATSMLGSDPAPEARATLVSIAHDKDGANAPQAVGLLAQALATDEIRRLVQGAAQGSPGPFAYRRSLIQATSRLHLREALPYLLREIREGDKSLSEMAEGALAEIQAYHARLARYAELERTGGSDGKQQLTELLKDPDPEIRRAAVLSLAALGEKESLPQLVRIAKDEKDPRVRQAALQAIERLATTESVPKPAAEATKPQPEAAGSK